MGSRFRLLQQLHQRALGTPLRAVSSPLTLPMLLSPAGQSFGQRLLEAMAREGGVGLAAPQVGKNVRMFAAELDEAYEHEEDEEEMAAAEAEDEDEEGAQSSKRRREQLHSKKPTGSRIIKPSLRKPKPQPSLIVNPRILWSSTRTVTGPEGCLSLPGLVGLVPRPPRIRVSYLDGASGQLVESQELKGFRARVFLHELDHLDGVLFTDRLADPRHLMTDEAHGKRAKI